MELFDEVEVEIPLFFILRKIKNFSWVFTFFIVIYNVQVIVQSVLRNPPSELQKPIKITEEKKVSDSEIIELLRQKKPEAIDALLKKYGPLMKYIIEPILSDYREREECLSDVTYRIWDKIDTFQLSKGGFSTWISAITRNAAYNRAKANKLKGEFQEIPEDTKSNDRSPEEEILRKEKIERLHKAIDKLSKKEKQLVYRKYFYLQSTEQIAAELGLTVRGVEGRLYRIKKRLRGEFDE